MTVPLLTLLVLLSLSKHRRLRRRPSTSAQGRLARPVLTAALASKPS
jgi:hypothetical protein